MVSFGPNIDYESNFVASEDGEFQLSQMWGVAW